LKRVLFVENSGDIVGGGQISLLALMQYLDRQVYEPLCVCPGEGSMTAAVRQAGIPVRIVEQPQLRLHTCRAVVGAVWRLSRLVQREHIELIHANGSRCMFYAGLAGKLARVPVVWHVRVLEQDGWWDRLLALLSARIIVISQAVKSRFSYLRSAEKLRVIHNGVDLQVYARADGTALRRRLGYDDYALVGMVAQLIPWKRHTDFIRAMAAVAARHPQARFLVVGSDPEPGGQYECRLKVLVDELGLADRVVFMGFHEDMAEIMALLDVVVLTSENEPFGRVLIEAMAASRPVVATQGGGVPEIVQDKKTGLLVPVGGIEKIAAAVEFLLEHRQQARSMGEAGQRRAKTCFSIKAHTSTVECLYREVLKD
jgi:glycosyltransferase involved in cell wall biosynthesis